MRTYDARPRRRTMAGGTMQGTASNAVVIVEDDASMTQALARILRLGGLVPVLYESAEALLGAAARTDAVCLIIDVQLPGIDGFALRRRLAAKGALPPTIFITAFDEPEARAQAAAAGAMFVAKPFSGRLLLQTIRGMRGGTLRNADTPLP